MLKVLIVDDEFLVRVGLESTIPWNEYGLQLVGSAKNGREAIELFEKYDPDILVTDIRMPGMSGLELIEALKSRKPSLVAIILSHYDDFNYAQKALKLGANDYILKSDLSPKSLIDIITKHVGTINQTIAETEVLHQDAKTKVIYQDFLLDDDFSSIRAECDSIISHKSYAAVLIRIYSKFNSQNYTEKMRAFENITAHIPSGQYYFKSFLNKSNGVLYVYSSENLQIGHLVEYIKLIKANLKQYLDIDINVGISLVFNSEEYLRTAIIQAGKALKLAFFEPSQINVYNENTNDFLELSYFSISTASLKHSISTGDNVSIHNNIKKILDQLENEKNIEQTRRLYQELTDYAYDIAQEQNGDTHIEYYFDDFSSFDEMKAYIINLFDQLLEPKKPTYSYIISKCIKYIEENYHKNITLSDLANYTNKSYLSTLFKLETSVNFSIFLINYRIEKAKKLLAETDYMVYEIADMVGFNNPYYFSKVFKDTTGMSCKTYRDQHQSKGN